MTKIVINTCVGGFNLSATAETLYCAYADITPQKFSRHDIDRDSPILLQVIEQLGIDECHGKYASLKIVEIPDDVEWGIEEYDGKEHVAEAHRTWY
jgi:hypothetical protein